MDFLKEKCEENSTQIAEQKGLPSQAEHKKEVAATQLEQLWGYAEAFENTPQNAA